MQVGASRPPRDSTTPATVAAPSATSAGEAANAAQRLESDLKQIFVTVRRVESARGPITLDALGRASAVSRGPLRAEPTSLASWEAALSSVEEERVLVAGPGAASLSGIEVFLALTAWPEFDVVMLGHESGVDSEAETIASIYRREPLLEMLRARSSNRPPLEIARLRPGDLGFELDPNVRSAGTDDSSRTAGGR